MTLRTGVEISGKLSISKLNVPIRLILKVFRTGLSKFFFCIYIGRELPFKKGRIFLCIFVTFGMTSQVLYGGRTGRKPLCGAYLLLVYKYMCKVVQNVYFYFPGISGAIKIVQIGFTEWKYYGK